MGLQTPVKVRTFQRKLYLKAKAEQDFRFYLLYDKIYRADILRHAYQLAKANGGSAGVDGMTFEQIESAGVEEWLSWIRKELRAKAYSPQPVLRVIIPKPGGGRRALGIPTTQIAYRAVERNVYNRVRRFLVSWHKVHSRGIHRFPSERVFAESGYTLSVLINQPWGLCYFPILI